MKISALIISLLFHLLLFVPFGSKKESDINLHYKQGKVSVSILQQRKVTKTSKASKSSKKTTLPSSPSQEKGLVTPSVSKQVAPEYPYRSKVLGEQGLVIIDATISKEGNVLESKIDKSSGYQRLDNAALEATKKSSFTGAKEKASVKLKFMFKL